MPSLAQLIVRTAARHLGVDRSALTRRALGAAARGMQGPSGAASVAPVPDARSTAVLTVWAAAVVLFLLTVVNADLLLPGEAHDVFRVTAGAILVLAGGGSLARRLRARDRLVWRLAGSAAGRARRRLVGAGLTLLGFAFLGVGVFDLARGASALAGS